MVKNADDYLGRAPVHDVGPDDIIGSSWAPIDLAPILSGETPAPSFLFGREDGAGLLYRGKLHSLYGEPESGKTWLALLVCSKLLAAGEVVCFIDFEDAADSIVGRLRQLGVPDDQLLERFLYIRPEEPLKPEALEQALARTPALVVLDGITEALTLEGLDPDRNKDVATFTARLPRMIQSRTEATVVQIDHVSKDRESRGRYAIGAQHKLAGIDGVAFGLELLEAFVPGREGKARLVIRKDRPGAVRAVALDQKVAGVLHVASDSKGAAAWVAAPDPSTTREWRPTRLMESVSRYLEGCEDPPSKNHIESVGLGGRGYVRKALAALVQDGCVRLEPGPRGAQCARLIEPFRDVEEES